MNTENNPAEQAPAKPAIPTSLEQYEVPEVMDFLKENGIAIVVGVLVAVAGFVGYSIWKNAKSAKLDAASALLTTSQTIPQFQEIIANYPETPAAPLAMLSLAAAQYDQAQYDLALSTFEQFAAQHAAHDMLPVARLGIAQSKEALARYDEALAAYDDFLKTFPESYMAPNATFGKARVLEATGKFEEAKAVYEAFIAANPDSPWTGRAETGLRFAGKEERASKAPAPQQ